MTVIIGSFDPLTLLGLGAALAVNDCIVVLASDLSNVQLESAAERTKAGVVIVGETVAHALLERLKALPEAPAVVVLGRDCHELYRTTLLAAGVMCLACGTTTGELITAVLAAGKEAERRLPHGMASLTRRQKDVMQYLSRGLSYKEVAAEMHLSPSTVKAHAAQIKLKLGLNSKREMIGQHV